MTVVITVYFPYFRVLWSKNQYNNSVIRENVAVRISHLLLFYLPMILEIKVGVRNKTKRLVNTYRTCPFYTSSYLKMNCLQ
jgi:hypothetical protein